MNLSQPRRPSLQGRTTSDASAEGLTVTNAGCPQTPVGAEDGVLPASGPKQIGKYQVVKLLGRGGMGVVYQAYDPLLERDVALKVMLPTIAEDPELKRRFEREARAVARLAHPAVVTVFDLGYHTDGSPYIVMELLRGRDLVSVMRHGPPLSLQRKLSIGLQVLDGLGHAHKAGIVHRDVKPANVFLTEDGAARIMDFGIARFMSAEGTGTGSLLGTASYMSPEQVQGDPIDGRSDLFSVGTLLCELLTGRRPYDGSTPVATLLRIANGEPEINLPSTPEYGAFEPVLRRALARRPVDRYATAAEFATALRATTGRAVEASEEATPLQTGAGAVAQTAELPRGPRADLRELFRLLREVHAGGKSGHLHLTIERQRKTIAVLKGEIVYGTSDTAGEHLGDLLVQRGVLSQEELERVVPVVLGERKRLGVVLLQRGLVDRSRLQEAIGQHARVVLFGALEAQGVSFSFEELSEDLLDAELSCPLSVGQVIFEATQKLTDPKLVRSVLGDTGRPLRLSANPRLRMQKITLAPADGFVLSRVDGALSAREIVGLIPLPPADTERSLFSLLCTGIVEYQGEDTGRKRSARAGVARERGRGNGSSCGPTKGEPPPQTAPQSPPLTEPAPLPTRPAVPPAEPARAAETVKAPPARDLAEIRRLILETHARLKLDHFEVLGLERTATRDEVREAFGRLARVLHPDSCKDPALDDLREKRQEAFIRVSEACETLRNPSERARYEQAFAPRGFRSPSRVSTPAMTAALASQPTATTPASEPNPMPAARAASPAAASSSHPPIPDAPALPADPPPPGIDPRLEPGHLVAVAREHFEKGQYWDAIQQLEPVVAQAAGPTRSEAALLLARAYLKNPHWKRRAEGVLQELLGMEPDHVPALLLLAEIYAGGGMVSRAKGLCQKVLKLLPGNAEAQQCLAALDPDGAAPKANGGGLRRLLGGR